MGRPVIDVHEHVHLHRFPEDERALTHVHRYPVDEDDELAAISHEHTNGQHRHPHPRMHHAYVRRVER